jgi:hypothetical protein
MIPFGPWHPDKGQFFAEGASEAKNCIRSGVGYRPLASLQDFNAGALLTAPTFLSTFRANDGTMYAFAGDQTKLYRLDAGDLSFDDVSDLAGYASSPNRWQAVQWGDELVLSRLGDPMQVYPLAGAATFTDLKSDGTGEENAPQAKFLTACGPYLVAGHTIDSVDGTMPQRLRWCGIEDIRAWLPSAATTADWQDVPDVGHLTGLTGGQQLCCLFENGVVVGSLIGAPKAFRFDRLHGAHGCLEPHSVVMYKGRTYYLARDGFQMFDGQRAVPIGDMKASRWFFKDALFGSLNRMSVAVDPQQRVIMWLYCGSGGDGITPNRVLLFNFTEGEFSTAEVTAQLLGAFATPGYTVDTVASLEQPGLGVDGLPAPLDDPFYAGGVPLFGAFVANKLHTFTGNPMTATVGTNFQVHNPRGGRSLLTEVRGWTEGEGAFQCSVQTLDDARRTPRQWPAVAKNSMGIFPVRAEGRWHAISLHLSSYWTGAYGVDPTIRPLGER